MPATPQTTDSSSLALTTPERPSPAREMVAILDYGSQYSRLIARRVRECHIYCELLPASVTLDELRRLGARGVILSGGPDSVYDEGARAVQQAILESDLPVLGICYGMHLLAHQLGGHVEPHKGRREYGPAEITLAPDAASADEADQAPRTFFAGVEDATGAGIPVWMSHGDSVGELPPGFSAIARSTSGALAAMSDARGRIGIQFHPEVSHTPQGAQMLENFLYRVCGLAPNWTTGAFIEETVARIQAQVGAEGRVICGLSGGVDSAVAALLVHRAIGDRLTCIFVDTGCMRAGEPEQVVETFRANLRIPLVAVDASERFLTRLAGVTDPEQKRRIIGEEFVRVFEGEAAKLQAQGEVGFLAQGTLYPDVIESASAHDASAAQKIKTHHNVGGLPEGMKFALVEPLRYLFKDEAREVGRELGLPEDWVWRHPFPGPGLAIRVIGEVTRERLDTLRHADAIFIEELRRAGLYRETGQAFAVLTSVQSVGVMGDGRTYASTVALRAVTTGDYMTADWTRLPYDLLGRVANRIVNEEPRINRVVYDITSKPPATIEWE
ncbi:MAG TPA: glutamine-hydrolyzing GMP synthase [Ktedonobacterales bacterium]|nr:glutamine-hydrolyzing GMP synthase [Ktedonobacterales bacterium]